MKAISKKKRFILGVLTALVACILALIILLLRPDVILSIAEEDIFVSEIENMRGQDGKANLAYLVELEVWKQILVKFDIGTSDDDIELFMEQNHPDIGFEESFEATRKLYAPLAIALEGVLVDGEPAEDVFDKYLVGIMTSEQWDSFLLSNGNMQSLEAIKETLNHTSYSQFKKESVEAFRNQYAAEVGRSVICQQASVKNILDEHIAEMNLRRGREKNYTDGMTSGARNYQCLKESNAWLREYFQENHKLYDQSYAGFEKYLSFYRSLPYEQE